MGPQLLDDPVVAIPAAVAALLIAYSVIYRKGILPTYHFFQAVGRIAEATPILVEIAEEFRPNGGNSVRDVVDRIEGKVDDAVIVAETTKSEVRNVVDRIETKVDDAVVVADATKSSVEGKIDEHLALPAWHNERDDVLHRLTRLEAQGEAKP